MDQYIHRMEYHLAFKRNEPLMHATASTDLRGIIQSERSQSLKIAYCLVLFTRHSGKKQNYKEREQIPGGQGMSHYKGLPWGIL